MPDTTGEAAQTIAERVRQAVAEAPFDLPDGRTLDVTVSVGVSSLLGLGDTLEAFIKRADEAVYEAKQAGRNRVILRAA